MRLSNIQVLARLRPCQSLPTHTYVPPSFSISPDSRSLIIEGERQVCFDGCTMEMGEGVELCPSLVELMNNLTDGISVGVISFGIGYYF